MISAPPGTVTVGNEVTSATIRTGTCAPARNSGTTEPIATLFAVMNALVAMAGIAATGVAGGSSTSCPVTGADPGAPGPGAGAWPGAKVNVAARLLEAAKELGADTLVSQATYSQVEGQFQLVALSPVVLRGRQEPTPIYRLSV